jgi:5-methylcytosine-specific restriction endonuclease McrA
MRSSVPDGDLATIIEEAVTEKLERLESKRFGKTNAPRKTLTETNTSPKSRHIPAAVKRAVYERDQGQCTYVAPNGRRCSERHRLEFHHGKPFGRGGDHRVENVHLMCRAHNGYFADRDYGKKKMKRYRRSADRVSEPAAIYVVGNEAYEVLGLDRVGAVGTDSRPS